jgi:hypothetical protein
MPVKISYDVGAPTASLEIMIVEPLADYDLLEVEAPIPRDVDPMLASQGFQDLLDEVRSFFSVELAGGNLEIAQLTGAICHDKHLHRPGVWLVLRERDAASNTPMSDTVRPRVTEVAANLVKHLQLA